jgi:CRP-like cAMP-binding protein
MFGLGALVQGGRRGASVRAIGPVRAARLPQSAYEMLMRDPSPIGRELLRAIAQQLASDLRTVVRQFRAVLEPPRA